MLVASPAANAAKAGKRPLEGAEDRSAKKARVAAQKPRVPEDQDVRSAPQGYHPLHQWLLQ